MRGWAAFAIGLVVAAAPSHAAARTITLTCPLSTSRGADSPIGPAANRGRPGEIHTFVFNPAGAEARVTIQNVLTNRVGPAETLQLSANDFTLTFVRVGLDPQGRPATRSVFSIDRSTLELTGDVSMGGRVWWSYHGTCVVGRRDTRRNRI